MIEIYGETLGLQKHIERCMMCGITPYRMSQKHGDTEGPIRYKEWLIKTHISPKLFKDRYSKISQELFFSLLKYIDDKSTIMFKEYTNKEFFIDPSLAQPILHKTKKARLI
jgi:hypothetical protein